jgi:hypothetical protein
MIETKKRDDLDGKSGGKHYLVSNAAIPCFESRRKVVRNRIVCVACGAKWNPSKAR